MPECMYIGLKNLLKHKDPGVKRAAEGALWTLDERNSTDRSFNAATNKRSSSQGSKRHYFMRLASTYFKKY